MGRELEDFEPRARKKIGAKDDGKCYKCHGVLFEKALKGQRFKVCRNCKTENIINTKIET